MRTLAGFGEVRGFRKTLEVSAPHWSPAVARDLAKSIPLLTSAPPLAALFDAGGEYAGEEGAAALIRTMVDGQVGYTRASSDKAGLILAHAVLDAAATELLKAVALAAPEAFIKWLGERKVPLGDALDKSREGLIEGVVQSELERLERESLLVRVRRLLAILDLGPGALRAPDIGYQYSEDELTRLDGNRHALLHGRAAEVSLETVDRDIAFLEATAMNLWAGVMSTFQLVPEAVAASYNPSRTRAGA